MEPANQGQVSSLSKELVGSLKGSLKGASVNPGAYGSTSGLIPQLTSILGKGNLQEMVKDGKPLSNKSKEIYLEHSLTILLSNPKK